MLPTTPGESHRTTEAVEANVQTKPEAKKRCEGRHAWGFGDIDAGRGLRLILCDRCGVGYWLPHTRAAKREADGDEGLDQIGDEQTREAMALAKRYGVVCRV